MADIPKELSNKWEEVDYYFNSHFIPHDPILESALRDSDAAGLPQQNVAPNQGKFLRMMTEIQGAKSVLEIGTLGAYSTIWFARGLPESGKVITLEYNPAHAAIAKANVERAKLSHMIEIRVGAAADSLKRLVEAHHPPFDLIFIDADKINNTVYFEYSMKLSRSGTLIIADNVVRNGNVLDGESTDPSVQGVQRFTETVAKDTRVTAVAMQTVGSKGYDGFALIRVL